LLDRVQNAHAMDVIADLAYPLPVRSSARCSVSRLMPVAGSVNGRRTSPGASTLSPKWMGTGDMAWRTSPTQIAWKSFGADG
jgi:hypothetical protein